VSAAAADGAVAAGTGAANPYTEFHVLLDSPADSPAIGYDGYADALTEIIMSRPAAFAVGILGGWGSGKTTLMRAIVQNLDRDEHVVPVWFAAWRYEREPNLILPLLDVLREALEKRAEKSEAERGWARAAAVAVSRAGLAFLAGLKLKAGLPGGVGIDLELGKTIDAIRSGPEEPEPLSFYHAGYQMLSEAIEKLSAKGTRRIVIFIDDLDRCLPTNALDVLESMKLFFDVDGCVFVVGLDNKIVEKAVALKYRAIAPIAGQDAAEPDISGSDYVKKLFQVPFTLPPVTADQLKGYLDSIEMYGGFDLAQVQDFRDHVRPHFEQLQGADKLNLREIKRRINLYTTQLKILSRRLGESLDPNVVLALLCMNSRSDWEPFYEQLAADPEYFQKTLREVAEEDGQLDEVFLAGTRYALPLDLAEYLRGRAAALLHADKLEAYILTAESTWTTDPTVLEARMELNRLRRAGKTMAAGGDSAEEALGMVRGHLDNLFSLISAKRESSGPLGVLWKKLDADLKRLMAVMADLLPGQPGAGGVTPTDVWKAALPPVDALDKGLLEWHRYVSLGS
jgi:KAP family P-loop domain